MSDLDGMRAVGALDFDLLKALRCTKHRRLASGTHGREREAAWTRKDLTGINGRATIKASKPPSRDQVLHKEHFRMELRAASIEMFSRCGSAPQNSFICLSRGHPRETAFCWSALAADPTSIHSAVGCGIGKGHGTRADPSTATAMSWSVWLVTSGW